MKHKGLILYILAGLFVGTIGRVLINESTLLINTNTLVPESYLPIEEYVLIDSKTNQAVSNIKCIEYEYKSTGYTYDDGLKTSKGINAKSTWDEFVDAYKDYYVGYIICTRVVEGEETYDNNIYLDNIKISDFINEYIDTGIVNVDDYNIHVNFSVYTRLNKIYYLEDEAYDYVENLFWKITLHRFSLDFSYECKNYEYNLSDKGVFDYISSDRI